MSIDLNVSTPDGSAVGVDIGFNPGAATAADPLNADKDTDCDGLSDHTEFGTKYVRGPENISRRC